AEVPAPTPARADPDRPWRVVIDAGHGGRDPGTVGRRSREKDIALSIATELARRLEAVPGFVPVLTRDGDEFVRVRDRPRFAVEREGDLFLSIHANSAPSRSAYGYETYFLGLARTEEARQVAMRENAAMELEEGHDPAATDDLQFILAGLDRNENLLESRRFAGYVQNGLRQARGRDGDRGVKQGPYWVLLGALTEMPSILVEVGFVSNAQEERVLRSRDGQTRIARALAEAIEGYRADLVRRVQTASQSSR
ncbi:MAG: N-acetylmuramoyl-L-alanine amidase family protein, partial [Gemmatimonadota bacterium]